MNYSKLLMIFPERLGDAIFLTPALAELHQQYPHLQIDAVTLSPLTATAIAHNPHIHKIISTPSDEALMAMRDQYQAMIALYEHPTARHYETILQIKKIGPALSDALIPMAEIFKSYLRDYFGYAGHEATSSYQLYPQANDKQAIEKLLREKNVRTDDILVGVHLGCHGISKRKWWKPWQKMQHRKVWPLPYFAECALLLKQANPKFRFVLTGSQGEQSIANEFKTMVPDCIDVLAQTSVLELAALMQQLKCFIASDTGAMHVACSQNIPVVALFGPTLAERTGPYPTQAKFVTFENADMSKIKAAEVADAVLKLARV